MSVYVKLGEVRSVCFRLFHVRSGYVRLLQVV